MTTESGLNTPLDKKTVALGGAVFNLRQDIDLHMLIGLNAAGLKAAGLSGGFFGRVQQLALTSIAMSVAKLFEVQRSKYELYSIPAIVGTLPEKDIEGSEQELYKFERTTGIAIAPRPGGVGLGRALDQFLTEHENSIDQFRTYRDKAGAHHEFGAQIGPLPSHAEFEAIWQFADSVYRFVHEVYNGCGPALMRPDAAVGLRRTLKTLGVNPVRMRFPD